MADTNNYEVKVRNKLESKADVRDYDLMQFAVGDIRGLLGMLSDCRAQIAASERRANEMRQAFIDALNNSQTTPPAKDAAVVVAYRIHWPRLRPMKTTYEVTDNALRYEQVKALNRCRIDWLGVVGGIDAAILSAADDEVKK